MKIGVLALQGGFAEHMRQIESLGHKAIAVRNQCDLEDLSGIILPGGESTTIAKLLKVTGLMEPLKNKIKKGNMIATAFHPELTKDLSFMKYFIKLCTSCK